MSHWKHIVWDWNGTLLDDTQICVQVLNELIHEAGLLPITPERYRDTFDFPVIHFYRTLGFPSGQENFEAISHRFIQRYHEEAVGCPLQEGVTDLLQDLQCSGKSHSILSAAKQDTLEVAVETYGLKELFIGLNGARDIFAHGKQEAGRTWIRNLPWSPEEIVLIGDTAHDYDVAQAMGTDCILVAHGHHSPSRLQKCGVPVVENMKDLRRMLQK